MDQQENGRQPLIAFVMGDPAGIGAEIGARVLADEASRPGMDVLLVGDRRLQEEGAATAGVQLDLIDALDTRAASRGIPVVEATPCDRAAAPLGTSSAEGGRFASAHFALGLKLAAAGLVDAVCFTPFNKHAMRLAHPDYVDETGFICRTLGIDVEGAEFNVLDGLWNARVTSHIPLSQVAGAITRERVAGGLERTRRYMEAAGVAAPRIAVAGLNPHAGDGGNFGREEIDMIGPAVADAQAAGVRCEGPFPPDTVFVQARRGRFDAVLTMYHDQGQIAMKLIGFDDGVTLIGGYPFPITTPAHGSAYDIAGQGVASANATRRALTLAADLAARLRGDAPFPPVAERLERLRRHPESAAG